MYKLLVPCEMAQEWAQKYSELVERRDTFIHGGTPDRNFAERFMNDAKPLVAYLNEQISRAKGARHGNSC